MAPVAEVRHESTVVQVRCRTQLLDPCRRDGTCRVMLAFRNERLEIVVRPQCA